MGITSGAMKLRGHPMDEALTDGGECGLSYLVAIERFVAPDDNPVERKTSVIPIPVRTIRAPP
jgi:hypothetical protein